MLSYILVISQLFFVLKANLIASGNGVSVAGRLNRGSLSSTVIKTQQQLNEDDQQRISNQSPDLSTSFDDIENDRKVDDSHFRLYYKSNSPGRSLSHELEHRYFKNPSNSIKNRYQEASPYQARLNPFLLQDNKMYANYGYNKNNYQSAYQDQHQQQQQQQQQKMFRNSILKMLLMNIAQNQQRQRQQQQINRLNNNNNNNNNGLQYKIVHLKFKMEPQHGIVGQGVVETDNGAGAIINSKQFSLLPRELPDLVRRLLYTTQQQQQPLFDNTMHRNSVYSVKKKRSEDETLLNDVEKRKDLKSSLKEKTTNEDDDKMNDNEFQESLKSLQRRDDSEESSLLDNENEIGSERLSRNDDEASELDDGPQL